MSDERIVRWAARGSEAAFAVIFERHHQALHRYCYTIVGNGHDASDALQSTMLKAFRALAGETREIALRPWLYRIAHNESISLLRARRCDRELSAAAHLGDPAADGIVESRDRMRALATDLVELTEQQRGALLMRELAGLSFAEIAGALQISPAAAKQTVYESRRVLQALQAGRGMDCDRVRRTLSDGDRRALRGTHLRGHLRACEGCRDFEQALRTRPARLAALAPPLPLGAAATMLHGLLGGGGFGTGGGFLAGLAGGAPGLMGASLAAKVAVVAVVATTVAGTGALVVVPAPSGSAKPAAAAPAATPLVVATPAGGESRNPRARTAAPASTSARYAAPPRAVTARATTGAGGPAAAPATAGAPPAGSGHGARPARGASAMAPGRTRSGTAPGRTRSSTAPGGTRSGTAPGRTRSSTAPGRTRSSTAPGRTRRDTTPAAQRSRPPARAATRSRRPAADATPGAAPAQTGAKPKPSPPPAQPTAPVTPGPPGAAVATGATTPPGHGDHPRGPAARGTGP